MRKCLYFALSALTLSACNTEDILNMANTSDEGHMVTVEAICPNNNSRLSLTETTSGGSPIIKVDWRHDATNPESFMVLTEEASVPSYFTQKENNTFTGNLTVEADTYYAFYPKADPKYTNEQGLPVYGWDSQTGEDLTKISALNIPFDMFNWKSTLASQDGVLDENKTWMYAVSNDMEKLVFKHITAIVKFTLKGIEGTLNGISIGTSDLEDFPLYSNLDLSSENYFIDGGAKSSIKISTSKLVVDENNTCTFYVYLPPVKQGKTLTLELNSVTDDFTRKYKAEVSLDAKGIEAGKFYDAERTMTLVEEISNNYTAGTFEELEAWISAAQSKPKANLTLTADIEIPENYEWPMIMNYSVIDGAGHSISGLKITNTNYGSAAFLTYNSGTVKNLHLKDVYIACEAGCAGITLYNTKDIIGCSISGIIKNGNPYLYTGAIAESNLSGARIIASYCNVDMETGFESGVIAGTNEGTISSCYSLGKLTATSMDKYLGGVIGVNYLSTASVFANYWKVEGVENGIGTLSEPYGQSSNEGTTMINEAITWEAALEEMNKALPGDVEWKYIINIGENSNVYPLVLQKK